MEVYEGANLGRIVVSDFCQYTLLLNPNILLSNTNFAIIARYSLGIFLISVFSRAYLRIFKPARWGLLGFKPPTSAVTRMAISGTLPIVFIFFKIC